MKEFEPTEIGKHKDIIKSALKEMAETDVLVCGKCYSVFHYVEPFKEHKSDGCDVDSSLKDNKDTKPEVWAFLLWKNAQQNAGISANFSVWDMYYKWVTLDVSLRDTWEIAGKTILSFQRVGQRSLREMPVKITKTIIDNSRPTSYGNPKYNQKVMEAKKREEEDKAADSEKPIRKTFGTAVSPKKESSGTPMIINKGVSRRALRTVPKSGFPEFEEETVEKIIAKRFNPRRKFHEYLVKWERLPHDQNTWEPKQHLESCSVILETFEKQLARQKAQRNEQSARSIADSQQHQQQQRNQIRQQEPSIKVSTPLSSPGNRPARNSKVKAVNQVKQWCNEEQTSTQSGVKRKLDDSDFEGSAGAADDEDDFEDEDYPKHANKRLKNGNFVTQVNAKIDSPTEQKVQSPKLIKAINGPVRSISNEPSAEVILTADAQQSTIIRKPTNTPSQKNEAQIRVLSKGETTTSGVVRSTTQSQTPKPNQMVATRITQVVPRNSPGSSPNTGAVHQGQVKMSIVSKDGVQSRSPNSNVSKVMTTVINSTPPGSRMIQSQSKVATIKTQSSGIQRQSLSPNTSANQSDTSMNKSIVTRVVKSSPATSKQVTPEQKIIQLSKTGGLKVTKKVINQMVEHGQVSNATAKQEVECHDDNSQSEQALVEAFVQPPSPPRPITLCPVTGKVFTDGQPVPSPVPSPEPEEKKEQPQPDINIKSVTTVEHKPQQIERPAPTRGAISQPAQSQVQQIQLHQTHEPAHQEHQHGNAVLEHETNAIAIGDGEHTQIITSEDGPLLVTGEDGTIYQVAGKNAEGQTILIAQGADGEQLAYVAADDGDEGVLTLGNNMAEVVAHMSQEDQQTLAALSSNDPTQALTLQTSDSGDSQDGNIPAEVVQADLPSPGGTRRVVLLLQDGTFMMTEMHDDEYQALNIAS